jgi:hypothetical protein
VRERKWQRKALSKSAGASYRAAVACEKERLAPAYQGA